MLNTTNVKVVDNLWLSRPLTDEWTHVFLKQLGMDNFDKDGFDLNLLEQFLYTYNDIQYSTQSNRCAVQQTWLTDSFNCSGVRVDHSYVIHRYGYCDQLAEQIKQYTKENVMLNKLLQIKPKWGIDINLEYVFDDGYILDLLHYEEDFYDFQIFNNTKNQIEQHMLTYTDGQFKQIADIKRKYNTLNNNKYSDDINDNNAITFNFSRAYKTLKVI